MKVLKKSTLEIVSGGRHTWQPQALPGGGNTRGYPFNPGSNPTTWLAGNRHGVGLATSFQRPGFEMNAGIYGRPSLGGRPASFFFGIRGTWR